MDFTLTEDQQAYVEAATAFANEALKPHAARWDKEHEFPIPTIKQAAGLVVLSFGLLGIARAVNGAPSAWLDAFCITPLHASAPQWFDRERP